MSYTGKHAFAKVSGTTITVSANKLRSLAVEECLEGVDIEFDGSLLIVTGTLVRYGYILSWPSRKTWLEDLSDDAQPIAPDGHSPRTIGDWISGKKRPYLRPGWYRKAKTTPYTGLFTAFRLTIE